MVLQFLCLVWTEKRSSGRVNTFFLLSEAAKDMQMYGRDIQITIQNLLSGYHGIQMIPLCCLYFLENRKDKEEKDGKPHDACRVHGSFEVNKVAGNFHVTAGK